MLTSRMSRGTRMPDAANACKTPTAMGSAATIRASGSLSPHSATNLSPKARPFSTVKGPSSNTRPSTSRPRRTVQLRNANARGSSGYSWSPMMLPNPPMNPIRLLPASINSSKASRMVCSRSGCTESNRLGAGLMSMNTPCGRTACRRFNMFLLNGAGPIEMNPAYLDASFIRDLTSLYSVTLMRSSLAWRRNETSSSSK